MRGAVRGRTARIDLTHPVSDHPLNNGLVSWWMGLNGRLGNTLYDLKGRNRGTLTNGPTWGAGPTPGFGAVQFDGLNDIVVGPTGLSQPAYPFTITQLLKLNSSSGFFESISCGQVNAGGWSFKMSQYPGTGTLGASSWGGAGNMDASSSVPTPTVGVWTLVAMVFDNTCTAYTVTTAGVTAGSFSFRALSSSGAALTFAGINSSSSGFSGSIQSTWYHARALSSSEPAALFDQFLRGYPDTLRRYSPRVWSFGSGGGGGVTADVTITEAGDSAASAATVTVSASTAQTQDDDSVSSAVTVTVSSAGALTQEGDTGTATGAVTVAASGDIVEAGDSVSANAGGITATVVITEEGDSASTSVLVTVLGSEAVTEAGDSVNANAGGISASVSIAESGDTAATSILIQVDASVSLSPNGDTLVSVGSTTVTSSVVVTESGDSVASYVLTLEAVTADVDVTQEGDSVSVVLSIATAVSIPGGIWRRNLSTWTRVTARALETWNRVWRFVEMPLQTEGLKLISAVSDSRDYAFDLTDCQEIKSGATISSMEILGGTGLTIGTPQVNTQAFDGISAGKAAVVSISGGNADTTYSLACKVTFSNGKIVIVPGRLLKKSDY